LFDDAMSPQIVEKYKKPMIGSDVDLKLCVSNPDPILSKVLDLDQDSDDIRPSV
jgi:hypothetical protein